MERAQETALARFYGLPNVHKEGIPLRLIGLLKDTPTYGLAKWLFRRLHFLTVDSDTTVCSSAQFLELPKGDSEALELAASLFHLIETKRSFKHPTEASYVLRTTYALAKRFNDLNSLAKSLSVGEHVSELLNQAENAVDVDVSSNTDSGHLNSVETDRRIAAELTTMLS
ncbi:hypothetical protein SprV_0502028100 [Sparganum proliferum]